jgi:hypothetical protein
MQTDIMICLRSQFHIYESKSSLIIAVNLEVERFSETSVVLFKRKKCYPNKTANI